MAAEAGSQILATIADEAAWKKQFAEKRDVLRRMAQEALEQDAKTTENY